MSYLGAATTGLQAYSAIKQGQAASYNSKIASGEQNLAIDQGAAGQAQVLRSGREATGRQAAAFGASGVGYGGSSAGAMKQSAINVEMDALNAKYKGTLSGYGYGVESALSASKAKQYDVLAGAALLKGVGSNYTNPQIGMPSSLSDMAIQ